MFISEQCQDGFSLHYFEACFHELDKYHTQLWPFNLAFDFTKAFCAH
jgi:hypothetical protein